MGVDFFGSTKRKHESHSFLNSLPLHYPLYEVCILLNTNYAQKIIPDRISEIPQNQRWKVESENQKLGATEPTGSALTLCCASTHLWSPSQISGVITVTQFKNRSFECLHRHLFYRFNERRNRNVSFLFTVYYYPILSIKCVGV